MIGYKQIWYRMFSSIAIALVVALVALACLAGTASAVTHDYVYVADAWEKVSVIDAADNHVVGTIDLHLPYFLAASSDGHWVYAIDNSDNIYKLNATSMALEQTIAYSHLSNTVTDMAISPDGRHLYIVWYYDQKVDDFNLDTGTATAIYMDEGVSPTRLEISADGSAIFVSTNADIYNACNVTVYSASGDHGKLNNGVSNGNIQDVVLSPDGAWLYVPVVDQFSTATPKAAFVYKYRTSDMSFAGYIPVAGKPTSLEVSPDGDVLYVINYDANRIDVYGASNSTLVHSYDVGPTPWKLTLANNGTKIYVACLNNPLSIIDTQNDTVTTGPDAGSSDLVTLRYPATITLTLDPWLFLPTSTPAAGPSATPSATPTETPVVVTATAWPSATVTETATPGPEPSAPAASPTAAPSAAPTASPGADEKSVKCLGVPILSIGAVIALGPLRSALRKRRLP